MNPNRSIPPTRRGVVLAAVALAGGLLAGCGLGEGLAGVHPAPSEVATVAPLSLDAASSIVSRVLGEGAAARATSGDEGAKARKQVMNGPALAMADAAAKTGVKPAASEPLTSPPTPTILAMSRGVDWPRAILATTFDQERNEQTLHVLTSASAPEPFVLTASVPMFQGAALPGMGDPARGVELVKADDGAGMLMAPQTALTRYAKGLGFPKPKVDERVSMSDSFASSLKASADAQKKSLGDLADLTMESTVVKEQIIAFRLAGGGSVVFGRMNRLDRVKVTERAEEITIPKAYAKLIGKDKASTSMELVWIMPVALVVPTEGKVTAIGATEQLAGGKAE